MVTDRATFGYLGDVFVLAPHRGRGMSHWLIDVVRAHPDLQGLRRFILATADAHALYAAHGWEPLRDPERLMSIDRDPAELYGGSG